MNSRTKIRVPRIGIAALYLGAVLSMNAVASPSAAQTNAKAAKESFPGEQQWKTFFYEAKKAYAEKRWAEAKSLLLKASAIKMTSKILGNLAQAEIQLGEYRAAATHAAEALAEPGKSPGSTEDLALASKYVGKLVLTVNVDGATVKIDGEDVGIASPGKVFFVEPGMRQIEVSKAGYAPVKKEALAQKGAEHHLEFELVAEAAQKAAPVISEPPQTKPQAPPPTAAKPFEEPKREPAKANPVILIAGGAVAVGGLVTGLVLNSKANSEYDKVDSLMGTVGPSGCFTGIAKDQDCRDIATHAKDGDRYRRYANISAAVGGVALVGTLVYWLWPRGTGPSTSSAMHLDAKVGPSGAWVGIDSAFW